MGFFSKENKSPRIEVIYGLERLYLKSYDDALYVVAKKGNEIRQICVLEDYESGAVQVQNEDGKKIMITLQSVSR